MRYDYVTLRQCVGNAITQGKNIIVYYIKKDGQRKVIVGRPQSVGADHLILKSDIRIKRLNFDGIESIGTEE